MYDYQLGKIYRVDCHKTGKVYIGSTIETLEDKMFRKVVAFKCWKKGYRPYESIFDVMEGGDYSIHLVENYPCDTKRELLKQEGHYQRSTPNCVNRKIEGLEVKDDPVWYKRKVVCPCGKEYSYSNATGHRLTKFHRAWQATQTQR